MFMALYVSRIAANFKTIMRVVVIGAQTYLGFHLTKALIEAGYEVAVADAFKDSNPSSQLYQSTFAANVQVLNVTEPADLGRLEFSAVINLSQYKNGQADLSGQSSAKADFVASHAFFEDLLNLSLKKNVHQFLNIESAESIYGKTAVAPVDERSFSSTPTTLGASQIFAETYLAAWVRRLRDAKTISDKPGDQNFFTYACLRLTEVFGPSFTKAESMPGFIGKLTDAFLNGSAPTLPNQGNQSRDLIHYDDAVSAILACLKKLEETSINDVFNVGSGVEIRDAEVSQSLLRNLHELGSDPESSPALQATLRVNEPYLSHETSDGKQHRFCLECTKFRAIFGWRPRTDLFRSLKSSVEESFGA